jgi:hypothetical protein
MSVESESVSESEFESESEKNFCGSESESEKKVFGSTTLCGSGPGSGPFWSDPDIWDRIRFRIWILALINDTI